MAATPWPNFEIYLRRNTFTSKLVQSVHMCRVKTKRELGAFSRFWQHGATNRLRRADVSLGNKLRLRIRVLGNLMIGTWVSLRLTSLLLTERETQAEAASNFYFESTDFVLALQKHDLIIHVAKESSPLAEFGGVGQVVGELASLQASTVINRTVVVILPKYRFMSDLQLGARFRFTYNRVIAYGAIYNTRVGHLHALLIEAPTVFPQLWQSRNLENMYDCPRGMRSEQRDLYFSFVASEVIKALAASQSSDSTGRNTVVHVHSATNAPVMWFLKKTGSLSNARLIYTIHDYDSEPHKTYSLRELSKYSQIKESMCGEQIKELKELTLARVSWSSSARFRHIADKLYTRMLVRSIILNSAYFTACADMISTVSKGVVDELLKSRSSISSLLASRIAQSRVLPIGNWVSTKMWSEARMLVSIEDPYAGKLRAKRVLMQTFRDYGVGPQPDDENMNCLVGWNGRFDRNKGTQILSKLHKAICMKGCIFSVAGYATSKQSRMDMQTQFRKMRSTAFHKNCPFYFFDSKEKQRPLIYNLRAATDINIVPSQREAFGIVAAEALAFGAIAVVSSVGGLRELVEPYVNANTEWTGLHFSMVERSEREITVAASAAIAQAIDLLRLELNSGDINALQRRLIECTPRLMRDGDIAIAYTSLYSESIVRPDPLPLVEAQHESHSLMHITTLLKRSPPTEHL